MQWVVDASVTLAWCFDDEQTERTNSLLDRATRIPFVVPQLWSLEIGNALMVATRRGRLTTIQRQQFLSMLRTLQIHQDAVLHEHAFSHTLPLAEAHGITAYDAAYLELAMRMGVPLAASDDALRRAASAIGVSLL